MPDMGGQVKCLVRGVRDERLSPFLQRCLLKVIRKVVRTRSLPHTLVLVVKNRRSPTSRPRQKMISKLKQQEAEPSQ